PPPSTPTLPPPPRPPLFPYTTLFRSTSRPVPNAATPPGSSAARPGGPSSSPTSVALTTSPDSAPSACPTCAPNINPPTCCITPTDRKSTRLNSSHSQTSYAVFCLKKK